MRYRDLGPGWLFVPVLILTILLIWILVTPAEGLEVSVPCPDPARQIHYLPLCLTEAEYLALITPKPAPAPPTPLSVSPESLVRVIAEYFWPDWAVERMVRIARCESGFNPRAYNGITGVKGLWQIHPLWQVPWPGDYYDPWTNGAVAYQVWLEAERRVGDGFRPWACRG